MIVSHIKTYRIIVAGINDVSFVGRGRNILSCGNDGTCRLWDCGSSECVAIISTSSAINCLSNNISGADGRVSGNFHQ